MGTATFNDSAGGNIVMISTADISDLRKLLTQLHLRSRRTTKVLVEKDLS